MILVDASHYLMRNVFMNLNDIQESPNFLAHLILNGYLSIARNFGAASNNRMLIAMDSRPTWRHEYYAEHACKIPGYKGKKYKGSREKREDIDWNTLYQIFDDVHEALDKNSDFDVVKEDRAEADDVIAIAARVRKEKERVFIISSDKDFKQLQDEPKVMQYDPIKKIFIPRIDADFFLQKHIIMGDGGDEIDAIKSRCGEKTAEKMVKDLSRILASNAEMRIKYEFNDMLINFTNIPQDIADSISKKVATHEARYDMMELSKICEKYSLRQIFGKLREFKLPEISPTTKLNSYLSEEDMTNRMSLDSFFD